MVYPSHIHINAYNSSNSNERSCGASVSGEQRTIHRLSVRGGTQGVFHCHHDSVTTPHHVTSLFRPITEQAGSNVQTTRDTPLANIDISVLSLFFTLATADKQS